MMRRRLGKWAAMLFLCGIPVLVLAQAARQNRTLVVTGHPGELPVVEIGGRSYVEIEAVTRFVNGSLSFNGNQIVLTLPGSNSPSAAASSATSPATAQPAPSGFSQGFLKAAIEQMAVIREWRSALISGVQMGFPITDDWMKTFSGRALQNYRLTAVATTTDTDRNALQLLKLELNNMQKLSDRFVQANQARSYIAPTALDDDPLDQKILNCGHSLAAMAANNHFVDDGSCQ